MGGDMMTPPTFYVGDWLRRVMRRALRAARPERVEDVPAPGQSGGDRMAAGVTAPSARRSA